MTSLRLTPRCLALLLPPALAALACTSGGQKPESYSAERSQAVVASDPAAPTATPPAPATGTVHAPPTPAAGPLCDQKYDEAAAKHFSIPGGRTLKKGSFAGGPGWSWINLWAAWCKPCKEEMPIIDAWAKRLRGRGGALKVVYLSIDDDERELKKFMAAVGGGLDGDFVWLASEESRARLFAALAVNNPPALPLQALLDPSGRLRCVRTGSIAEKELDEAAATFRLLP